MVCFLKKLFCWFHIITFLSGILTQTYAIEANALKTALERTRTHSFTIDVSQSQKTSQPHMTLTYKIRETDIEETLHYDFSNHLNEYHIQLPFFDRNESLKFFSNGSFIFQGQSILAPALTTCLSVKTRYPSTFKGISSTCTIPAK